MKLIVPAYYDADDPAWEDLAETLGNTGSIVILNPDSGPGSISDVDWANLCVMLRRVGVSVSGYVHTREALSNGEVVLRSFDLVASEIQKYLEWYLITDIFLDEVPTDESFIIGYFDRLRPLVKGRIILNHGAVPHEDYLDIGDILVTFENDYTAHQSASFPLWIKKSCPTRFAHIVHSVSTLSKMVSTLVRVKHNGYAGWAYVTNRVMDNPYDQLPIYWSKEVNTALKL